MAYDNTKLTKLAALKALAEKTKAAIPTKVSQLANDSKYQTDTQVATAIQTAISKSGHAAFKQVDAVPEAADAQENILYLVMNDETKHYDIYALVSGAVVLLDDTTVDLSGKVDKVGGKGLSTNDYTTEEKDKLAGVSAGANRTEASTINGNIKVNGAEVTVYTEPDDVVHGAIATDAEVTEMLTEVFGA